MVVLSILLSPQCSLLTIINFFHIKKKRINIIPPHSLPPKSPLLKSSFSIMFPDILLSLLTDYQQNYILRVSQVLRGGRCVCSVMRVRIWGNLFTVGFLGILAQRRGNLGEKGVKGTCIKRKHIAVQRQK